MAEATLGMSSLDRLRELKEETERRQAGGKRRVVDLPIGEVHPDPRQVRSDFVADVLSAEDQEELEGLARNIAAIGIHNPIHVRPDPDGGYVIISGERRWRAAGIAGLETVPCLVAADADHDTGRNTLTQLSENKRCLDETGLGQAELAKELGKSKSWVSKYLTLLKAEGPFREALDEGLLGNPETARIFGRLDEAKQSKLLRRARKQGLQLSHAEIAMLDRRNTSGNSGSPSDRKCVIEGDISPEGGPEPALLLEGEGAHTIRVSSAQLRRLIECLGGSAGEESTLVETLWALLAT